MYVLLLALLTAEPPSPADEPGRLLELRLQEVPESECVPREQREDRDRRFPPPTASPDTPLETQTPYPFHPQGGVLHRDLAVGNYVDLDPSPVIKVFNCSDWAYDGHNGHDVDIYSFPVQAIGVPVFAALDGTVLDVHDGEPDTNTTGPNVPANYVFIQHAGTQVSRYYHLKKNSVAVSVGQPVVAGTQIGLTGSSGSSTWPHLHFETQLQGAVFEPYAGACRAGASGWVTQPPVQATPVITDWTFSTTSFAGFPLPADGSTHTGTFLQGSNSVNVRFQVTGVPALTTARFRFQRPNGTILFDTTLALNNATAVRQGYYTLGWGLGFDVAGAWKTILDMNGQTVAEAPFTVIAGGSPVNRPPAAVTASLGIPMGSSVPFCTVQTSLITRDPDYDVVRYRYLWKVNGSVVRDKVFASLSDALPRNVPTPGSLLTCEVTPSDGTLSASTATAALRVPDPAVGDANGDGVRDVFDVVLLASLIVGNATAGVPPFSAPLAKMQLNPSVDSVVDVFDLVLLVSFVVGNVPSLPV